MRLWHSDDIWAKHPGLVVAVMCLGSVHAGCDFSEVTAAQVARAKAQLTAAPVGEWPQIQAWRRAFTRMGLKPTQYRCAAESLLRRLRKEGDLPRLHPLVDLCNAVSAAHGIPIAVFDRARIGDALEVRPARGTELFLSFAGELERVESGEIIFADDQGRAHARRWAHRQSAWSAMQDSTREVVVVAEAMHAAARDDLVCLMHSLDGAARDAGLVLGARGVLTMTDRRFVG